MAAYGARNNERTCSACKSQKKPMFKFPKGAEKREAWREFLGLESTTACKQICSSHFRSEDVKEGNGCYRLVKNAFPHYKLPECATPVSKRIQHPHTHGSARPTCMVPGCENKAQDEVSVHYFPRLFERRRQWATIMNLEKVPSGNNLICSSHFAPTDFHSSGSQKSLKSSETPSVNVEGTPSVSVGPGVCQVLSEGTSNEEPCRVAMSNQDEDKSGGTQGNSLHSLADPGSTVGLKLIDRDSETVLWKRNLEEQCLPRNLDEASTVQEICVPSSPEQKETLRDMLACPHNETCLVSEAEEGHALEEVLNISNGNDATEISSVFKRLSDRMKADISQIGNSPSDFGNSSVNFETSLSVYVDSCSSQTETLAFDLFDLIHSDTQLKAFTGVTYVTFNCLLKLVLELCDDDGNDKVQMKKKIFLTLCKLRLNLSYECLSVLVGIDRWRCGNYFNSTVHYLAIVLQHVVTWPLKEETALNMPKCFKKFRNTRVVLDCFEVPVISPDCLKCRIRLYSHYKGGPTAKVLVGIAPSGLIIFVSDVYGGRASDKKIFQESDLLYKLEPHLDAVMLDKGFRIDDACNEAGIKMHRPPFIKQKQPLDKANAKKNSDIAHARVHVERAIQRIRIFKILQSKMSWSMVPYLDEIVVVIAGLVNLSPPILCDEKFLTYDKV